jgi:hypothetical protein
MELFLGFYTNVIRLMRQHGPITRIWLGQELVVWMADPRHVEVQITC